MNEVVHATVDGCGVAREREKERTYCRERERERERERSGGSARAVGRRERREVGRA